MIDVKTEDTKIIVKAKGALNADDFKQIRPLMDKEIEKRDNPKLVIELEDYGGMTPKGFFEDMKMGVNYADEFDKIAVVGPKTWQKVTAKSITPFIDTKIKFFENSEKEAAELWVE